MCRRVGLTALGNPTDAIGKVLSLLQKSHRDGGALFASFRVGESEVFDWSASRNRLAEYPYWPLFFEGTKCRRNKRAPAKKIPAKKVVKKPVSKTAAKKATAKKTAKPVSPSKRRRLRKQ